MRRASVLAALAAAILGAGAAPAAPTPSEKCEAGKNKIAGVYYACRQKAEAVAIAKGVPAVYSKCTAKFDDKWSAAETLADGMCPDNVETADINAYLASQAADAAAIIAGTAGVPECGDGLINVVGEHCDGAELGGNSCASLGQGIGALACSPACTFDGSSCAACPGFSYAEACWIMSANMGISCDAVCAEAGLDYDPATETVAGSGGTDAACEDILDGLGAPGTGLTSPSLDCGTSGGLGCLATFMSTRARCAAPATTSTASALGVARACACQ